jgi:hypothetical protein
MTPAQKYFILCNAAQQIASASEHAVVQLFMTQRPTTRAVVPARDAGEFVGRLVRDVPELQAALFASSSPDVNGRNQLAQRLNFTADEVTLLGAGGEPQRLLRIIHDLLQGYTIPTSPTMLQLLAVIVWVAYTRRPFKNVTSEAGDLLSRMIDIIVRSRFGGAGAPLDIMTLSRRVVVRGDGSVGLEPDETEALALLDAAFQESFLF